MPSASPPPSLLHDLLTTETPLPSLAAQHNLSLSQLLSLLNSPETQAELDAHTKLAAIRAAHRRADAETAAITSLRNITTDTDLPPDAYRIETIRKAACALLRLTIHREPPNRPARAAHNRAQPNDAPHPTAPPTRGTPSSLRRSVASSLPPKLRLGRGLSSLLGIRDEPREPRRNEHPAHAATDRVLNNEPIDANEAQGLDGRDDVKGPQRDRQARSAPPSSPPQAEGLAGALTERAGSTNGAPTAPSRARAPTI